MKQTKCRNKHCSIQHAHEICREDESDEGWESKQYSWDIEGTIVHLSSVFIGKLPINFISDPNEEVDPQWGDYHPILYEIWKKQAEHVIILDAYFKTLFHPGSSPCIYRGEGQTVYFDADKYQETFECKVQTLRVRMTGPQTKSHYDLINQKVTLIQTYGFTTDKKSFRQPNRRMETNSFLKAIRLVKIQLSRFSPNVLLLYKTALAEATTFDLTLKLIFNLEGAREKYIKVQQAVKSLNCHYPGALTKGCYLQLLAHTVYHYINEDLKPARSHDKEAEIEDSYLHPERTFRVPFTTEQSNQTESSDSDIDSDQPKPIDPHPEANRDVENGHDQEVEQIFFSEEMESDDEIEVEEEDIGDDPSSHEGHTESENEDPDNINDNPDPEPYQNRYGRLIRPPVHF